MIHISNSEQVMEKREQIDTLHDQDSTWANSSWIAVYTSVLFCTSLIHIEEYLRCVSHYMVFTWQTMYNLYVRQNLFKNLYYSSLSGIGNLMLAIMFKPFRFIAHRNF